MNDRPISRWLLSFAAMAGFAVTGCGSDDVKLAPVSGTVKMNGDPLPGATVRFRPRVMTLEADLQDHPPEAFGKTDEKGHYELELVMTGEEGAVVGLNEVVITLDAFEEILPSYDSSGRDQRGPNPIPPEYNKSTKLNFEVPDEGSENADFNLENPNFKVPEAKPNPQQDA